MAHMLVNLASMPVQASIIWGAYVYVPKAGATMEAPAELVEALGKLKRRPMLPILSTTNDPPAENGDGRTNGAIGGTVARLNANATTVQLPTESAPQEGTPVVEPQPVVEQQPVVTQQTVATEQPSVTQQVQPEPMITQESLAAPTSPQTMTGPLPTDFPGYEQLEAAGFATYEKVRAIDLQSVEGIGRATAAKIQEALGSG